MGYGLRKLSCTILEKRYISIPNNKLWMATFLPKMVPQMIRFDRFESFVKLRYSGVSQEDRERDNCQEVRVESSQSRAWTAMLKAPL